jgi:Flp pilus assembly protein TadB
LELAVPMTSRRAFRERGGYSGAVSRPVQLLLVTACAYAAALAVDYFFAEGRLGFAQVAVMVGSVVVFWAWRSRKRRQ